MKRKLSALLALLTVTGVMASCASDTGSAQSTTDGAANVDVETTTAAETTTASEYVDPGMDFEGAEFYIASYESENIFWVAASYCDAYAKEENGDPINDAVYARNRAIEEELNVKLICRGFDSTASRNIAASVQPLILAGDDQLDMIYQMGNGLPTMMGTGNIIDLNIISTLDLTHSWWDASSVEELSILGANYAVTGDASLYANFAPVVYLMNKQVAEDYGVGNLYDVVRDGTWTIDTAMEKIKMVSADINGDGVRGKEDAYGLACETGSIMYMLDSCDVPLTKTDSDGIPQLVYNTEKTVGLIEKLIPFVNDKNYVTFATDYSGYSNAFTEVLVPMFQDNRILFFNNQLLVAMELRNMESDFGILPNPKYNEAQDDYISFQNNSWVSFVTVPATCNDLDMTGYIIDALGYYSQQLVTPAYIDTTVMGKALRDDDSAEMLEIVLNNRHYDIAYYYNWGTISGIATGLVSAKSTDFASKYASVEASILSGIDETIEFIKGNK